MAPVAVFLGRAVGLRPAAAPRSIRAQAERSYVMVKPDGVQRGLVGQIITRFEQKGFQIKGLKMFQTPEELAKEHYKDLSEKPFYGKLVEYVLSGPVVCIVCSFIFALIVFLVTSGHVRSQLGDTVQCIHVSSAGAECSGISQSIVRKQNVHQCLNCGFHIVWEVCAVVFGMMECVSEVAQSTAPPVQALEGDGVVKAARKIIGATNPLESEPGTIRGDFAIEVGRNVVHGSDSPENGERELALWFKDGQIVEWESHSTGWLKE